MSPLEIVAGQIAWAGKNMAYNLEKVPADKLNWKPAETSNSALEVAHHAAGAVTHFHGFLSGNELPAPDAPADLEAAKKLMTDVTGAYAAWVRTVDPATLGETVQHPFLGTMPRGQLITVPIIDFVHHHGQIAYIQTLLGDTESHFAPM